jgi:hypothetical protein
MVENRICLEKKITFGGMLPYAVYDLHKIRELV